jgi:anaerobic selenocysteine-containing dehydrogenase
VFQWGGAWLCEDGICPTPDGRGTLIPVDIPDLNKKPDQFIITSRRGKQFNSMVYKEVDPLNGAGRYDILMSPVDGLKLSIAEGEGIVVYNGFGVFQGTAKFVDIAQGNLEVHFPEAVVMRNLLAFRITTSRLMLKKQNDIMPVKIPNT